MRGQINWNGSFRSVVAGVDFSKVDETQRVNRTHTGSGPGMTDFRRSIFTQPTHQRLSAQSACDPNHTSATICHISVIRVLSPSSSYRATTRYVCYHSHTHPHTHPSATIRPISVILVLSLPSSLPHSPISDHPPHQRHSCAFTPILTHH